MADKTSRLLKSMRQQNQKVTPIGTEIILPNYSGVQKAALKTEAALGGVSSVFGRTGAVAAASDDYTWAQINKATSSIADITTKSHTALSDIGTNTHAQIDTAVTNSTNHIADNTQAHSDYLLNSGADEAVGPLTTTADNSTADQAYTPMVLYNTDATPPTASGFPIGTIYVQYTA